MKRLVLGSLVALAVAATAFAQEKNDREKKVRGDKEHVAAIDSWIYDDLPRGIEEAKKTGKPLLVVFRCIPCEACAKIDEDVVDRDPVVAKLLDQFVCVRIPHANGMDLSIFQFDYDQSWAAFLMNADMTIYGRYGTRSDRTHSENDVSLEGFAKAMEGALAIHAKYPENQQDLVLKQSSPADVKRPEEFATLKDRYKPALDWEGKVVPSCMHCHMIREAQRREFRDAGKAVPDKLLFPYPNPKVLGLVMDPKERARVTSVVAGSCAEKDGFRPGDEIVGIMGAPILSTADIQWALHEFGSMYAGTKAKIGLATSVVRDGKPTSVSLTLSPDWSRKDDISWRASSWDLRRMTTGGMLLETVPDDERATLGIDKASMALRAKHVGEYGEHAAAKKAGFVKGDVIVAVNGRTDVASETEWMTWLVNAKKPGEKVPVTVLRDGKKIELTLPMQ